MFFMYTVSTVYNFRCFFNFYKYKQKCSASENIDGTYHVLPIADPALSPDGLVSRIFHRNQQIGICLGGFGFI